MQCAPPLRAHLGLRRRFEGYSRGSRFERPLASCKGVLPDGEAVLLQGPVVEPTAHLLGTQHTRGPSQGLDSLSPPPPGQQERGLGGGRLAFRPRGAFAKMPRAGKSSVQLMGAGGELLLSDRRRRRPRHFLPAPAPAPTGVPAEKVFHSGASPSSSGLEPAGVEASSCSAGALRSVPSARPALALVG